MPQAIASALVTYAGFTATAATVTAYAVVIAGTLAYSDYSRRKAQARARAAANASAKDREVMIRSAIAPRRIVYGRDRISGPIVYMESTGDKSQYLHMVVALAAHECDAIETVYFNEVALPEADGDGWITSGEYAKGSSTQADTHTGTTNGSGQLTLPRNAESITAAYTEIGVGEAATQTHHTGYSHTAGSNTITGLPADTSVTIGYTYTQAATPLVRVRKYLGTDDQTACADLVAESDGKWTSDHRGRGICYLYVRLEYDQDVFGSTGVPNISAVVRGKKVYDPRTTTTAWSNNAALCVADYLRSDEGMRADSAEVPDSEIIAAANICDEEIDLSLDDEDVQARYTCDLSITTDRSPRDVLAELLACMSGRAVWTQGRWLVRPGAYRTPTLTITADMLAGPVSVMPKASRSELFNAVRATYRDATSFAELQAPLVENSGYEADDGGVQIVRQIDVPTLADTYRAQRLAKIELERARQALTVKLACNLKAYDLAPSDTVLLTLATYGWSAKAFEVLERTLTREGTIQYTLRETAAGVYDWAWGEATIGDLAPDTNLPNPFGLPAVLQNLAVDEDAIRLADGTIITQAVVTWDASESPFVANGGSIQYQTAKVGTPWGTGSLPGDATTVTLGPLQVGVAYVFRARAINASGRAGDWAYIGLVAEGLAAPPDDVTGLDCEIKPGQVWITWDPCEEADYAATELRYDGTGWDDATFLWRGAGSDYQHPRPPNGTYTVRAKHIDTSGTYSANAASISVTVDDTIDPTAAGATLLQLVATGFAFVFDDEAATTSASPTITFDAVLKNVAGSVTWTVTAYTAAGSSLGTLTLGGSGNTGRTLTAANFNSLGATTTRYVKVEATLGSLSDTTTIYRGDGGSDALNLVVSNESHTVPTAADGTGGSYSGANTSVLMYQGISDVTSLWTFAIVASGCTATINGGAGPVSGTGTVTVAVSAMSADAATVTINATRSGYPAQSKVFSLAKSKAGTNGTNGSNGTAGAGARRAYALFSGNPSVTGSTIVRAGDVLPLSNSWSPTSSTAWTATTQTPASGQALFQSDGIYDPSANTTTWQVPYLSNFKVGNLAALSAEVDGTQSLSIPDPGSASPAYTRSAALSVNGSLAANVGVYSRSNSATSPAMYGVNLSASSGACGLYGYGPMGVRGYASASSGYGVRGEANGGAGGAGVSGHGADNSDGVLATWAGFGGSSGVALRSLGSTVLDGPTTVTGQITITASGVPPFVLTSAANVPNLNADLLDGYHASSFQFALGYTPVQQGSGPSQTGNTVKIGWSAGAMLRVAVDATDFGSTWPIHIGGGAAKLNATVSAGSAATTGSATANFPGNNKPGSATTVQWIPWTHNGVAGYIPFWT